MVHVIGAQNAHLYQSEMEDAFRLRHRIFVDERKWLALKKPDKREIDQFDTAGAIHFAVLRKEKVAGYCRLLPTIRPHLLDSVYPWLCTREALPTGPHVFEWTRYCVAPEWRYGAAVSDVGTELIVGVFEYCLDNGISTLSLQADPMWLTRFHELGCPVHPLGFPAEIDGETVVAFTMTVSETSLERACALRDCRPGVLEDRMRRLPGVDERPHLEA